MREQLYPARVKALLYELCVRGGFCLPTAGQRRLEDDPPADIDQFTDAVFWEEGMDPTAVHNARLRQGVRKLVQQHFEDFWDNTAR
jgi:hypothetical protein